METNAICDQFSTTLVLVNSLLGIYVVDALITQIKKHLGSKVKDCSACKHLHDLIKSIQK
jgi:hypothetical protein